MIENIKDWILYWEGKRTGMPIKLTKELPEKDWIRYWKGEISDIPINMELLTKELPESVNKN